MLGQGEVHVVAAQDQVIADRHAVELHLLLLARADADQREVGRAAADVAHEDRLPGRDELFPLLLVFVDPGVKRRLRLFDQHDAGQSRAGRRLHRQLAGDLVERRRQREDDLLPLEGLVRNL
jgi:hypothetical protein